MTPLERARARMGNVTPTGQPIAARPDGGGLAVPDRPTEPDLADRDPKPPKVTVTPTVHEELIASTRRIDEALAGGPLPVRTPGLLAAQARLDQIGAELAAGKASRADFTQALEVYEVTWLATIQQARRP